MHSASERHRGGAQHLAALPRVGQREADGTGAHGGKSRVQLAGRGSREDEHQPRRGRRLTVEGGVISGEWPRGVELGA